MSASPQTRSELGKAFGLSPGRFSPVRPRRLPKKRPPIRLLNPEKRGSVDPPESYSLSWVEELRQSRDALLQALRLAEEVQQSLLPRKLPDVPGICFGASLRPCQYLAGDFYNVVRLDRDHLGVYLGDVMGHGPAAALLSVFAMQTLRLKTIDGSSYQILPPSQVLETLNAHLIGAEFPGSPFLTMIYGTYDLSRRVLTYCSGGHPSALLLRPGRPDAELPGRSALLGVFEDRFVQDEVTLSPGDRVIFYSDGFELVSFGEHGKSLEALSRLLSIRDGRSPQELVDYAMASIRPIDRCLDDLTVILMEVREGG